MKYCSSLRMAKLMENPNKCCFFAKEIKVLGYFLSGKEIKMDVGKIREIKDYKEPQNVKQLQEFLGGSNYYRSLIKDYAKIEKPLFDLSKKDLKKSLNGK